jgi:predicted enzyme related to lactoylglutathione lyase
MINYRVDDLDELLSQLKASGIEPVGGPDSDDNGKFAWIMDPDGNKVELWEPKLADEHKEDA